MKFLTNRKELIIFGSLYFPMLDDGQDKKTLLSSLPNIRILSHFKSFKLIESIKMLVKEYK